MLVRRFVAYLNLALFAAAVVAEILLPRYSTLIFYGLIGWMVASLVLFYGPGSRRTLGGPRPAAAGAAPPLPSGPPARVGFCVYCGTDLAGEASVCPACGKPVQAI